MKNFLKKNLWLTIIFIISSILLVVGALVSICFIIGGILMGVFFICIAVRCKKKYNTIKAEIENDVDENVFDATKYDYDEDVYVFDTGRPIKREKLKKGLISNISALAPTIIFSLFGVGLIILSITVLIKTII